VPDDDPGRRQRVGDPRPVGSSLQPLLAGLGVDVSPRALHGVFSNWRRVVGEQIAAHARPVSLYRGRLVVVVDHPAWAIQLRYLGPVLLDRFSAFVGETVANELVVRVGNPSARDRVT
jgi:predicted nucleic acid-binding Zn ribbon protein